VLRGAAQRRQQRAAMQTERACAQLAARCASAQRASAQKSVFLDITSLRVPPGAVANSIQVAAGEGMRIRGGGMKGRRTR